MAHLSVQTLNQKNKKKCKVETCNRPYFAKGYCDRHYKQFFKWGEITITADRTRFDPNIFIVEGSICRIVLFNIQGKKVGVAIIDYEDYKICKKKKWHLGVNGYATAVIEKKPTPLHKYIFSAKEIDHIDRDKLNNRKSNLRQCTHSQNMANCLPRKKGSKYKGIWFENRRNKWAASINFNNKKHWIGYFKKEIDAAKAYDIKAIEFHGEFAYLNFGGKING